MALLKIIQKGVICFEARCGRMVLCARSPTAVLGLGPVGSRLLRRAHHTLGFKLPRDTAGRSSSTPGCSIAHSGLATIVHTSRCLPFEECICGGTRQYAKVSHCSLKQSVPRGKRLSGKILYWVEKRAFLRLRRRLESQCLLRCTAAQSSLVSEPETVLMEGSIPCPGRLSTPP